MPDLSILTAAVTLLDAAQPTPFTTIGMLENQPTPYTPDLYPMVLVDLEDSIESRMGVGVVNGTDPKGLGLKEVNRYLCCYLWDYEGGPTWNNSTFLGYIETIKGIFRPAMTLASLADTSTTWVLQAGEDGAGIKTTRRHIPDGAGGVTRYAEIRVLVREGIRA